MTVPASPTPATAPDPAGARSRALAARVVDRVVVHGETLDAALAGVAAEAGRDRARVQALAYGTVRWHHRLARLRTLLLDRPIRPRDRVLESLLGVGLFELQEGGQPVYAVVSAAVEACRLLGRPAAAGLVNGILRRCLREQASLGAAVLADEEARHAHPRWLVEALRQHWPAHWEAVLAANQEPPPLWLRVNRRRTDPESAARRITAETRVGVHREADFPDGLRLETALPVDAIPGFAAGEISVQDAASQLAADLVDAAPGHRVLDACAAPGGKAAHLQERARGQLQLTALDLDDSRLLRLRANFARLGLEARIVAGDACQPAGWWDGEPYDRILVDAPCSGTGVIRRHPDIKLLRRPGDLPALVARQGELLGALWPLLRPGGRLVYATCSVLPPENHGVIARFLAEAPGAQLADPPAALEARAVPGPGPGWQLLPGPAGTDGFYYVVITKAIS